MDMGSRHQGSKDAHNATPPIVNKRCWTYREEEVLITALKWLVAKGLKSDNGFRNGYMLHLEAAMRKAFPTTDLRGKPHIDSKLTAWKRTYATLRDILARSGVGFNVDGDNKIDCDNTVWEEICKSDPGIPKCWRNKQWPFFESWKLIFGKDRATGDGAAELFEMLDEAAVEGELPQCNGDENSPAGKEGVRPSQTTGADDSVQSDFRHDKEAKNSKKRQFDDNISSLVDLVGDIQKTNAAKFVVFNEAFGKKARTNKARCDLWSILENLEGFTMDEMFDVGEKLLEMPARLELFVGLSNNARRAYVHRMRLLNP